MKSTATSPVRLRAWAGMLGVIALIPLALGALVVSQPTRPAGASSHREAPLISYDPEADNTDLYAFVSPDDRHGHDRGQLHPAGGAERRAQLRRFGDDVLYEIKHRQHRQRRGRHHLPVPLQHRNCATRTPSSTTPAPSPRSTDANWNMPQFYSVTRVEGNTSQTLGTNLKTPPVNIGPRSTPNYDTLARAAVNTRRRGTQVLRRAARRSRSSSTSARSSTWAACGRSTRCTSSRCRRARASTAGRASTRTPSSCRCRSPT